MLFAVTPEKSLWAGMLLRALNDAAGVQLMESKKYANLIQRDARAWFSSPRFTTGSFLWICDVLNLDPDAVKRSTLQRSAHKVATSLGMIHAIEDLEVERTSAPARGASMRSKGPRPIYQEAPAARL